jgi:hypothetical protein
MSHFQLFLFHVSSVEDDGEMAEREMAEREKLRRKNEHSGCGLVFLLRIEVTHCVLLLRSSMYRLSRAFVPLLWILAPFSSLF